MKNALLITILFLSMSIVGQKSKSIPTKITNAECTKKGSAKLKIYCNGGFGSIITKNDLLFQKKYSTKKRMK